MKIYVFKAKSIIKFFLLIIAVVVLISALGITGMNAVGVFSQSRLLPVYSVECTEKKVAITFDCAWGASDIPSILDTLKKENVKATFFVVGQWAEKYPDSIKAIHEAGHDLGNHSYSHLRMGAIDMNRIRSEISKCTDVIKELTGVTMDLFRAPYGDYSNNVVSIAREQGYYTIQWDVDSLDWKPGISKQEIMDRILRKIRPGSIILFHNDTPHTAELLPTIISTIRSAGYEFVPVSKLILRENYIIDHEGRQKKKE